MSVVGWTWLGRSGVDVVGAEWGGYLAWVIVVARHGVDNA